MADRIDSLTRDALRLRAALGEVTSGEQCAAVSAAVGYLAADVAAATVVDAPDPEAELEEHLASFFAMIRGMARVELARLREAPIPEDLL